MLYRFDQHSAIADLNFHLNGDPVLPLGHEFRTVFSVEQMPTEISKRFLDRFAYCEPTEPWFRDFAEERNCLSIAKS